MISADTQFQVGKDSDVVASLKTVPRRVKFVHVSDLACETNACSVGSLRRRNVSWKTNVNASCRVWCSDSEVLWERNERKMKVRGAEGDVFGVKVLEWRRVWTEGVLARHPGVFRVFKSE